MLRRSLGGRGRRRRSMVLRGVRNHVNLVSIDYYGEIDELFVRQLLNHVVGDRNSTNRAGGLNVPGDVDYFRELHFIDVANDFAGVEPDAALEWVLQPVEILVESE